MQGEIYANGRQSLMSDCWLTCCKTNLLWTGLNSHLLMRAALLSSRSGWPCYKCSGRCWVCVLLPRYHAPINNRVPLRYSCTSSWTILRGTPSSSYCLFVLIFRCFGHRIRINRFICILFTHVWWPQAASTFFSVIRKKKALQHNPNKYECYKMEKVTVRAL